MTDRYDPNDYTSYGGQPGGENQGPAGGQGNYPSGGYGQPGRPSQPYQGRPSQPYQGSPSQPYQGQYGQPGAPTPSYGQFGQPGPASQPYYNQQTVYTQPPAPKKSRRGLKIALTLAAVVLVLGAIGGGAAVFFINQFAAPGVAALQFCNQLKSQNYDGAYGMLSSGLQSQYSKTAFSAGVSALDTAEGKVIGCQQAQGSNAYTYSLGSSTATVNAQLDPWNPGQSDWRAAYEEPERDVEGRWPRYVAARRQYRRARDIWGVLRCDAGRGLYDRLWHAR